MLPSSFVIFVILLSEFLFSTYSSSCCYHSTPFLQLLTPSIWNWPPAKKIILLLVRSTKLQFSRKRTQVPNNEPSNNIEPISIPKTTKCFVSPYPITYKKPSITPASEKMGAHFIKTSLIEFILRPTHQRPN